MDEKTLLELAEEARRMKGQALTPELDKLYNRTQGFEYYRLAYLLSLKTKPDVVLELGTQYARCSAHFAAGNPSAKVYTVDAMDCTNNELFFDYKNITFLQGQSYDKAVVDKLEDNSIDIAFADTQHQTGHVLEEIKAWAPKMKKGALWLIDDLREMPDLIKEMQFEIKGTLVGLHTCQVQVAENVVDVGFGYAIT